MTFVGIARNANDGAYPARWVAYARLRALCENRVGIIVRERLLKRKVPAELLRSTRSRLYSLEGRKV